MHATPQSAHHFIVHLMEQHRDIEQHARRLHRLVDRGDMLPAMTAMDTLQAMLMHHDGIEDTVLFPLVQHLAPHLQDRLTFVREQHTASEAARLALQRRLWAGTGRRARRIADELMARLTANHLSEESLLYGTLESVLLRSDGLWRPEAA